MNTPPTILIADDHVPIRAGVRAMIEEMELGVVVATADRGDEAMEMIRSLDPDVALVDQRMPGMSGIDIARTATAAQLRTRVVILSSYDNPTLVRAAVRAGAAGYIAKDSDEDSFRYVLKQVHAGARAIDPRLVHELLEDGSGDDLSSRQLEVLERVANGEMNERIASEMGLSPETVKSHVSTILAKLGAKSRTEAAVVAVRRALIE
jgi:DNA-binding NarL/FixJ family response regulator